MLADAGLAKLIEDSEEERFRVLIETKSKHADLWPLAKKLGSQKALADRIGVSQACIGEWVNLTAYPNLTCQHHRQAVEKLHLLTGAAYEELWPPALERAIRSGRAAMRKDFVIDSAMLGLAERAEQRLFLPDPSEDAARRELVEYLGALDSQIYDCLTARERNVLRLRFGLDGEGTRSLDEVARRLDVTRERVRQIEARAIRKLRDAAAQTPVLRELTKPDDFVSDAAREDFDREAAAHRIRLSGTAS